MHTRLPLHQHGVPGSSRPCCMGALLSGSSSTAVHTHRTATLRSSSSSTRTASAHTNIQHHHNAHAAHATQSLDSPQHATVLHAMGGVLTSLEPRSFQEVPGLTHTRHSSKRAGAHPMPSPQPSSTPTPQQPPTVEQEVTERPPDSSSLHMEASTSGTSNDSDTGVWGGGGSGVHAWGGDVRVFGKKKKLSKQNKAKQQQQQQQQGHTAQGLSARRVKSAEQAGSRTASSAGLDSNNRHGCVPLSSRSGSSSSSSSAQSAGNCGNNANAQAGEAVHLPPWAERGAPSVHPLPQWQQQPWFSSDDLGDLLLDYSQFSDTEREQPQKPQKRQKWQRQTREQDRSTQPASAEMHLTYSIKAARSCQELQDLMSLHGQSMNHVHVSVMLTRLVQLSLSPPPAPPPHVLFPPSSPAAPPSHSPTHTHQQPPAHTQHALLTPQDVGVLHRPPLSPSQPTHPAASQQPWPSWQQLSAQQQVHDNNSGMQQFPQQPHAGQAQSYRQPHSLTSQPQEHGQCTLTWTPQTQQPQQPQQHPQQQQQKQQPQLQTRQQHYEAAGLPSLPPPPPQSPPGPRPATQGQLVLMLARKAREQLEQMGFWELSSSMACLVKLRAPLKKSFYITFMEATTRKFKRRGTYGQPSPQALVQLLWAIARCGMKGLRNDWAYMYLWAVEEVWDQFDLRSLVRLLHGLACLKHTPPQAFMAKLLGRLEPLLPSATTLDLAHTIWALARLRQPPPPAFMHAWLSAAQPRVAEAGPLELPSTLWGLGRLGAQPPPQWMAAALSRAAQLRPVLNGQGLSLTVYAAGLLRATPPPGWLHAMLTTASSRHFRGFGPQSMALLVYGACVLLRGTPPPGWLPAFHDALESMPQRFEPAGLELIREAFEVVGFIPRQPALQPVRPAGPVSPSVAGAPTAPFATTTTTSSGSGSGSSGAAGVAAAGGVQFVADSAGPQLAPRVVGSAQEQLSDGAELHRSQQSSGLDAATASQLSSSVSYQPSSNGSHSSSGAGVGVGASSNGSCLDGSDSSSSISSSRAEQDAEGEKVRQALLLWDVDRDGEWDEPGLAAAARVQVQQQQQHHRQRQGTVQKPSRFR